jgi:hypothetical protein
MPDATHYTYRVAWSAEDGEHVATVAEFPSLSWLAPTPVEALAGLADVVSGRAHRHGWIRASRFQSRCRNAPTRAASWCAFRQRSTAVLSAKLPNSV